MAVVEIEQMIYVAGQRNKRVRLEKINRRWRHISLKRCSARFGES